MAITEITASVMLDSTGHEIASVLERQNLLLTRMITEQGTATPVATLREIHEIVKSGEAANVFSIGDQIMVNWNDGTDAYILPFDIVHFADVTLADGEVVPGMFIQSHYALQGVQFDQNEGFYVVPAAGIAANTTLNFTIGTTWGNAVKNKVYQFTVTEAYAEGDIFQLGTASSEIWAPSDNTIDKWRVRTYKANGSTPAAMATDPAETLTLTEGSGGTSLGTLSTETLYGTSGLNNMQRAGLGYNRWSQSAIRQYLNSAAAVGNWWSAQNPYDRRPGQLASVRGMMAGFDEAFLNILQPVRVTTALNLVSDTAIGTSETTVDTFFCASLEQEYIVPQADGVEGEYWEYWKRRLGLTSPQAQGSGGMNAAHIRYAYDAKSTAQYVRLRSAYRGYACYAWSVSTSGYALTSTATTALRSAPACVIC